MDEIRVNISAPNIMCICIDGRDEKDSWGRLYCCYTEKEVPFENEYQLLKLMEELMEAIDYPQSSVQIRSFDKVPHKKTKKDLVKVVEGKEVMNHSGKLGTFVIHIQYRQNATWQGDVLWAERKKTIKFRSALEMLKLLGNALDIASWEQLDSQEKMNLEDREEGLSWIRKGK